MPAPVTIVCWLWQNCPFIEGVNKMLGSFEVMPKAAEVSPKGTEDACHIPDEEFWLVKVELLGNSCPLVIASRTLPIWSGDIDNWVPCSRPSTWKLPPVAFSVRLLKYSSCCWREVGPSSNGVEEWAEKLGSPENETGWPCHIPERWTSVKNKNKNKIKTN